MAFVLKDRVRETSVSTGIGTFALDGAVAGYQRFSATCSIGDTCWYTIVLSATSWETGIGTYSSANTLTRTTVFESSNAGSVVDFVAGTKDVFIGFPSSKMSGLFDSSGIADQIRFNTSQSLTSLQKTTARANIFADGTSGGFSAGDVKLTYKTVADTGWVMMNDGTFGDSSSGASTRANDDCADAWAVIWPIGPAASLQIFNSDGSPASYTTPEADFAAHKRLSLPKILGRALAGAGAGSGLTVRVPGGIAGAETVTIARSDLPNITLSETGTGKATSGGVQSISPATSSAPTQLATASSVQSYFGSDTYANINITTSGKTESLNGNVPQTEINKVPPETFLNVMLKL